MKRTLVALFLGIVVVAAFVVVKDFGLLRGSAPRGSISERQPGRGDGYKPIAPPHYFPGTIAEMPKIAFPGSGAGAPVMSESAIDKVLGEWTFPGAVDATYEYVTPGMSQVQREGLFGRYTRFLDVYASEAVVWRFYSQKAGVAPPPTSYFAHIEPPASQGGPDPSHPASVPQMPEDTEIYSKKTRDYLIQASLSWQINLNRIHIILQLAPRTKNMPTGTPDK